ncbi:MAG: GreA/GreB family elongation factor [Kofleriaceae bacterium]
MTKKKLVEELLAQLNASLETARAAHASAIEGSTHPEARAENDKDTRGLEQSYLARGQAQRVAELEAAIGDVTALALRSGDKVTLSSLVTVDDKQRYFIAPAGGGAIVGGDIQVITHNSPIGRALLGKSVDDVVEIELRGQKRELEITHLE